MVHRDGSDPSRVGARVGWRMTRRLAAAAACVLIAAGLAACGSSSSSSSSGGSETGSSGGGSSTTAADTGASAGLAKTVEGFTEEAEYELPSTPIKNIASLQGKTVYYIPLSQVIPSFAIEGETLKEALGAAGVNMQICDGGASPSKIGSCINQAVAAGAAGIATSGVSYEIAGQAFEKAKAKGIPILLADQEETPGAAAAEVDKVEYLIGADQEIHKAIADWIAVDSEGEAKILFNENTDNPTSIADIQEITLPELQKVCAECSWIINKVSTANANLIPSSVSSALLANPDVNYVDPEFDQFLEPTQQGVQNANLENQVKGASTTALLGGLQDLKAENFLYADVGADFPYQGWAVADAMYRMMLGMPAEEENVPFRLFTRENVSDLELNDAAQGDGSWFGDLSYQDKFKGLWGVK
jgi:ribose transport system substrate-binding protein